MLSRADKELLLHMLAGGAIGLVIFTVIMGILYYLVHTHPIPLRLIPV